MEESKEAAVVETKTENNKSDSKKSDSKKSEIKKEKVYQYKLLTSYHTGKGKDIKKHKKGDIIELTKEQARSSLFVGVVERVIEE